MVTFQILHFSEIPSQVVKALEQKQNYTTKNTACLTKDSSASKFVFTIFFASACFKYGLKDGGIKVVFPSVSGATPGHFY